MPLYWSLLLLPPPHLTSPSPLKSKKVMGLWNQGINWIVPAGKCRITLCPCEDLQFPWDLSVWHCWPFLDTQLPVLNSSRFLGSCNLVSYGRSNQWGKMWLYSCIIYMCPYTLIWGGDVQRARETHLQTSAESLIPKGQLGSWLTACALGGKKQTPFCWIVCLSTKLPILPKSDKVVHHHKKNPKTPQN